MTAAASTPRRRGGGAGRGGARGCWGWGSGRCCWGASLASNLHRERGRRCGHDSRWGRPRLPDPDGGRQMRRIRVLLADDHALVRAGVRSLLEKLPDVEVLAEASDAREALELLPR